jgi:hypothetical protein
MAHSLRPLTVSIATIIRKRGLIMRRLLKLFGIVLLTGLLSYAGVAGAFENCPNDDAMTSAGQLSGHQYAATNAAKPESSAGIPDLPDRHAAKFHCIGHDQSDSVIGLFSAPLAKLLGGGALRKGSQSILSVSAKDTTPSWRRLIHGPPPSASERPSRHLFLSVLTI